MNKHIKKLWIEALKSGKYRRNWGGCLRYIDSMGSSELYTAFGVLCDLYIQITAAASWHPNGDYYYFITAESERELRSFPIEVCRWAGFQTTPTGLSNFSHSEKIVRPWNQVIDFIEENL